MSVTKSSRHIADNLFNVYACYQSFASDFTPSAIYKVTLPVRLTFGFPYLPFLPHGSPAIT
ncbi:MAG: hypothetical protein ACXVLT_05940 [Flavisolibacter sp.]